MDKSLFYIGAMTPNDASGGIYGYTLDASGMPQMVFKQPACGVKYLAYSADKKILYSTVIVDPAEKTGGVAAYRIKADGSLEFINELSSEGVSTCHLAAAPGGKYLYAVNYFTSTLCEFTLCGNGALERLNKVIHFSGCGTHPRQEKPHPHFTGFTPDGKYLIVVDLGLDAVKLFAFDPEKGLTDAENPYLFKVENPGSGPRHLAFNRAGNIAYLVNEIGNTVCVLDYKAGKFSCRQIISTLPADFSGETKAAAIRLSPDERWLFASNRGYDSIAVYRVLPDGELALQDIVPSEGESPRDINFLPDGLHLAAANEFTNNTAFFKFDPESGKLAYYASESMPNPLAVYW